MLTFIAVATAIAVISIDVTYTSIFEPARVWVANKSDWFGELVSCPWCFSHWVAAASLVIVPQRITQLGEPVDFALTWLALVASASIVTSVIARLRVS